MAERAANATRIILKRNKVEWICRTCTQIKESRSSRSSSRIPHESVRCKGSVRGNRSIGILHAKRDVGSDDSQIDAQSPLLQFLSLPFPICKSHLEQQAYSYCGRPIDHGQIYPVLHSPQPRTHKHFRSHRVPATVQMYQVAEKDPKYHRFPNTKIRCLSQNDGFVESKQDITGRELVVDNLVCRVVAR